MCTTCVLLPTWFGVQAFALPVLQIVHETLTGLARTAAVASAAAGHTGEHFGTTSATSVKCHAMKGLLLVLARDDMTGY